MNPVPEISAALRSLLRDRPFSFLAFLILGLGAALVITMFSLVNGVFLRGLPVPDSGRLMLVLRDWPEGRLRGLAVPAWDFLQWKARTSSFAGLAAFRSGRAVNLARFDGPAERLPAVEVTPDFLSLLKVDPLLRNPATGPPAGPTRPAVFLSHRLWRELLAASPDPWNDPLLLDGQPVHLLGILPPGFGFPSREEIWIVHDFPAGAVVRQRWGDLQVFGRLRPGITPAAAAAELLALSSPSGDSPGQDMIPVVRPFLAALAGGRLGRSLLLMFGAVFLVLLLACANLTNLQLARTLRRTRDFAIHAALGATRADLLRRLLWESLLLATAGSLAGLLVASWLKDLVWVALRASHPSLWFQFPLDANVAAFVLGLTLLTAILSGLLPAVQASRPDLQSLLKDYSPSLSSFRLGRFSRLLVVFQVACSCALLIPAGLTLRNLHEAARVQFPFRTQDILAAALLLPEEALPSGPERIRWIDSLLADLRKLPGVAGAALATSLPGARSGYVFFQVEGEPAPASPLDFPYARVSIVTPGLFSLFAVDPLAGRLLLPTDTATSRRVALVNRSFAAHLLPAGNPVGRRLRVHTAETGWENAPWVTIVGVVPDLAMEGMVEDGGPPAGLYLPYSQFPANELTLAVRVLPATPLPDLARELRENLAGRLPGLSLAPPATLESLRDHQMLFLKVLGGVFSAFGLAALLLAALGLYGVLSFHTAQRAQELGIRLALGADPAEIRLSLLGQSLWQGALGLGLGFFLALALARFLAPYLTRVSASDPLTFLTVTSLLAALLFLAAWEPARRAARNEPIDALRHP